jgi:hypothetical protein
MRYSIPKGSPTHALNYKGEAVAINVPMTAVAILRKGSVFLYLNSRDNTAKQFIVSYGLEVKSFNSLQYAGAEFEHCAEHEAKCNSNS